MQMEHKEIQEGNYYAFTDLDKHLLENTQRQLDGM